MDLIIWMYGYYIMHMLNILNDGLTSFVCYYCTGLACASRSGCRVVWRVVLSCWREHIVAWVHWSSAYRSRSSVVAALACRMTHNSSLPCHYYMFLIIVGYVSDFHFNPLNFELNPICHLLALLGAHHILHVSRIRVNVCWLRICNLKKILKHIGV
jgi:hypothetical protein